MSLIGPIQFGTTVLLTDGGGRDVDLDLEVRCTLHCDSRDDGPYADDFELRLLGVELDTDTTDQLVDALDLEMQAVEHLMGMAAIHGEYPEGRYTRVDAAGYRETVYVLGTAKVDGQAEWYVIARALGRFFGQDTTERLIPVCEFRMPAGHPDTDHEDRYWKRVETMPRELKVGMRVMAMERPARIIKLGSYGGLQHATIEWEDGQEPKSMLLGPQQLNNPDIITMLGEVLLGEDDASDA